jgi:hypothetical protein
MAFSIILVRSAVCGISARNDMISGRTFPEPKTLFRGQCLAIMYGASLSVVHHNRSPKKHDERIFEKRVTFHNVAACGI